MDVKRVHFPVPLSVAVIFHRSQGQTLEKVVFDLRKEIFIHGCLYVRLLRVMPSDDFRILTNEERICPYELCSRTI